MEKLIVDRIEGKYVVLEYGEKTLDLPLEIFPKAVQEGDIIDITIVKKPKKEYNDLFNE